MVSHSYHHLHGLDITILRYFTVYGPAGRPDMSIFRFIQWIAEERPLQLFGDGHQERDFTYVEDIARAPWIKSSEKKIPDELASLLEFTSTPFYSGLFVSIGSMVNSETEAQNLSADTTTVLTPVLAAVFGQAGLRIGATLEGSKYTKLNRTAAEKSPDETESK